MAPRIRHNAVTFESLPDGRLVGWRAARYHGGYAVSGADSRQRAKLRRGELTRFTGAGMFLANDRQYVIDYYAGHEQSAIMRYAFWPEDVVKGNLEDAQAEISVKVAELLDFEVLRENPMLDAGKYFFVTNCIAAAAEDIHALIATETQVPLATFRSAIGKEQWKEIQEDLGYDRHFTIAKDWHVEYGKAIYRGVPAYFLRHSCIEWIYTLRGRLGASLAGIEEEDEEDEVLRENPSAIRSVKIKKGTLLYHGTSAEEVFEEDGGTPDGPAWFTDNPEVARFFQTWHGGPEYGRPRILVYRVVESIPDIAKIPDGQAFQAFLRQLERMGALEEGAGAPEELAEAMSSQRKWEGWRIIGNYSRPDGDDILLVSPERYLEFVGLLDEP